MHLVKGYSVTDRQIVGNLRDEECFRYPVVEEIAEVSCGDEEDDRPTAAGRRAPGRSMRVRALDRGSDLGFAYKA
jgi:hypothetical protein